MTWIAKVQEPMRDDDGRLIRDDERNLTWGRAADGRTYSQYGIINHKLPENHPKWVTVVPKPWIRFDTEDNVYFRGPCSLKRIRTNTGWDTTARATTYAIPASGEKFPKSKNPPNRILKQRLNHR